MKTFNESALFIAICFTAGCAVGGMLIGRFDIAATFIGVSIFLKLIKDGN